VDEDAARLTLSVLGCSEDDATRKLYGSFEQMILSYVEYVERDGKAW
jgi:hypothetical protein